MRVKSGFVMLGMITFALVAAVTIPAARSHDEEGRSLLVDTDMGLDDVRALFALIAGSSRPNIHGLITVEGSASLGKGTDNLIGLLEASGISDIDLYKGVSPDERQTPPPWRSTANDLGGLSFAPPRKLQVVEKPFIRLKQLLAGHCDQVHYLALGPLSNLAHLEKRFPGTLGLLHTVWMPVRFSGEGALDDWNLLWDIEATRIVLEKAKRIVLIDLSSISVSDVRALMSSIEEKSVAGRWFHALLEKPAGRLPHLMLYDELAAAALIEPDLTEREGTAWKMTRCGSDGIRLKKNVDGRIFLARFKDTERTLDVLRRSWSRGPAGSTAETATWTSTGSSLDGPRSLMKAFHGHLGPYVVLGYRMGQRALQELNTGGHFGISAEVHTLLSPPCSCLIDGIQLGSGCTLGKRNIEVQSTDNPAFAVFRTASNQSITIRLKKDLPPEIAALVEEKGVEAAAELYLTRAQDELFEIDGPQ